MLVLIFINEFVHLCYLVVSGDASAGCKMALAFPHSERNGRPRVEDFVVVQCGSLAIKHLQLARLINRAQHDIGLVFSERLIALSATLGCHASTSSGIVLTKRQCRLVVMFAGLGKLRRLIRLLYCPVIALR